MFNMAFARTWPIAALIVPLIACAAMAEDTGFASPAVKAAQSSARLLAAGPPWDGVYHAGVEINLEPKTITYWRQPGDTGAAPIFDFSRSENVASVEVLYPAPKHINEAEAEVAGYDAPVIFPLRVTPRDPAAPVTLRLALDYAACGTICLPAKAQLSLLLPKTGASPFAAAVAEAESKAPRRLTEAEAKKLLAITPASGGKEAKVWSLRYLGANHARDVFIEAPEPLYLEGKPGPTDNSFELRLSSSCCSGSAKESASIAATVTILTESGAIEAPAQLD
jgi:DsbC/DsbD-like thiol-disulfide interchange protein